MGMKNSGGASGKHSLRVRIVNLFSRPFYRGWRMVCAGVLDNSFLAFDVVVACAHFRLNRGFFFLLGFSYLIQFSLYKSLRACHSFFIYHS